MSADVKQETEKGDTCVHLLVPLDKIYAVDKLSQWNRTLRQARDAAQVLTAAVMAKRSLKVIERESGASCLRRSRRVCRLRKRHRSQTGMRQCKDPRGRKGSICRHRRSYDHSRMGGKFATTRGPSERRHSIEGGGSDGELCGGHPKCGVGTFSRGGYIANIAKLANKGP